MKLYLDFDPCQECNTMMAELSSPEMLFADEKKRADESAKFLRHLTYNYNEVVQAVMDGSQDHFFIVKSRVKIR